MTVPDSPENKCPDECPECGSEKRWPPPVWTDGESGVTEECWHPWHEKPRCPDCGGMGSGEGGFRGGKKWKAICPGCGGSGRINTSAEEARNQGDFLGDDLSGVHTCHAGCPCHGSPVDSGTGTRASVPSSPHETGLTAEQKARIEGLDSFGFVEWGDSDEAYLEALTNSGAGSRSDSEGEGLAARVERLAERMTGLARKQADEFGNYVSQGQFSADYKEGLASAYDDSAEALRSLLVPKEEA